MRFDTFSKLGMPLAVLFLCGCDGSQSALSAMGLASARIVTLSWVMFVGAALIVIMVSFATGVALFGPQKWRQHMQDNRLVIWLGIVFPIVTLSALLLYGFYVLSLGQQPKESQTDAIRISVTGHQWWWQVVYQHPDGTTTETANELRIPVDKLIDLSLSSADVLHSFWVPAYAGKVDMVPGRTNRLQFTAVESGLVRGQCAEYCGGAHALMAFHVEALSADAFANWLTVERGNAVPASQSDAVKQGRELFLASGCGGCHTIRGTPATGRIAPDLTHLANRHSIGAGTLSTNLKNIQRWIREHQTIKPGNRMPAFDFLNDRERLEIARFLMSLE